MEPFESRAEGATLSRADLEAIGWDSEISDESSPPPEAPPSGHQAPPSGHQAPPSGHQAPPSGREALPSGQKPRLSRRLLNLEEITRVINGVSPITVWREKRGMTVRQLAACIGMPALDVLIMEKGGPVDDEVLRRLSRFLDVLPEALLPPQVVP